MLKIIREDSVIDKEEKYMIIIDNLEMLEIGNDEIKNLNIKDGHHTIMIKNKSFISNKISFDINPGEIIEFECGPQYTNNAWSKVLYKVILGGQGLYLKKKMDVYL